MFDSRWFRTLSGCCRRFQRGFVASSLSVALCVFITEAHAVPGELRAGLELGGAVSSRIDASPSVGVRGGYGLGDRLELQVEASGLWLQGVDDSLALQLVPALAYRFDVVRWVPFMRVGAGPLLDLGHDAAVVGLASGAIGLEYLWDRSLAASLSYQADFWLLRSDATTPALPLHRVLLGVTWSSGW